MHCKCFCRIFSKSSCPMDRHGNVSTLSTSYKKWKVSSHFYTRAQFLSNIFTETYTYIEVLNKNKLDRKQNNVVLKAWIRFNVGQQDGQTPCFIYTYIMMQYSATHLLHIFPLAEQSNLRCHRHPLLFVGVSLTPQCCWWIFDTPLLLAPYSSSVSPTLGSPLS